MFQIYPFHGDDLQAVYAQANEFLSQLGPLSFVGLKPENIRADTKNYISYDSSVTTIDVVVMFYETGDQDITEQNVEVVQAIHAKIVASKPAPKPVMSDGDFDPFLDEGDLP